MSSSFLFIFFCYIMYIGKHGADIPASAADLLWAKVVLGYPESLWCLFPLFASPLWSLALKNLYILVFPSLYFFLQQDTNLHPLWYNLNLFRLSRPWQIGTLLSAPLQEITLCFLMPRSLKPLFQVIFKIYFQIVWSRQISYLLSMFLRCRVRNGHFPWGITFRLSPQGSFINICFHKYLWINHVHCHSR